MAYKYDVCDQNGENNHDIPRCRSSIMGVRVPVMLILVNAVVIFIVGSIVSGFAYKSHLVEMGGK